MNHHADTGEHKMIKHALFVRLVWKSVQFPLLRTLMGGYDNARVVHFAAMSVLVMFFVVHVVMVTLVPRSLLLMTRGR
jgi:thiosulfate reductase cytochrome b subunit